MLTHLIFQVQTPYCLILMTLPLYLHIFDDINSKLVTKELKAGNRFKSYAGLASTMV